MIGPAQIFSRVPTCAVEHQYGVCSRHDVAAQLVQEQGHCCRIAARQDQRATEVPARAHRTEEIDRLVAVRPRRARARAGLRSEEHTSELQSRQYLVCRLLLEKKK